MLIVARGTERRPRAERAAIGREDVPEQPLFRRPSAGRIGQERLQGIEAGAVGVRTVDIVKKLHAEVRQQRGQRRVGRPARHGGDRIANARRHDLAVLRAAIGDADVDVGLRETLMQRGQIDLIGVCAVHRGGARDADRARDRRRDVGGDRRRGVAQVDRDRDRDAHHVEGERARAGCRAGEADVAGRRGPRTIVCQRADPDLAERVHCPIRGVFQRQHRVDAAQAVHLGLAIGLDCDIGGRGPRAGDLPNQQRALILCRGIRLARVELGIDAGRAPELRRKVFEGESGATHGAAPWSGAGAAEASSAASSPAMQASTTSPSRSRRFQNCVSGTFSPMGDKTRPFGPRTTS